MSALLLFLFSALTPEAEGWLSKGIEASHVEDYTAARNAYAQAKKLCPDDPAPYFLDAALTFIYMSDFVTDSLEGYFDAQLGKTEQLARRGIEDEGENARDLFFLGSVQIFRMTRHGWKRNYLAAFSAALNALNPLMRAVELDPELYDAYLAKGAYDYFSGRVNRYIPGMKASATVERGIYEIRLVYEKGTYFRASAGQALSFILKEEGRASEALAVSRELVNKYPKARTFRWGLGDLYLALGMWSEARDLYGKLMGDVYWYQPKCYTNIYQTKLCLARAYAGLGEIEKAKSYAWDVYNNRDKIRRDLGYSDIVKDADNLLKKLNAK